jgi:uncharacterized protein YndB with AHSA1/START domain
MTVSAARNEIQIDLAAPIDVVWRVLTQDLSNWWPNSFCLDPTRVRGFHMEFKLGGRMYEDWGDGDGWLWWTIYRIDSQNHLFSAAGYESRLAIHSFDIRLTAKDDRNTTLTIDDGHWGAIDGDKTVAAHEAGWNELFRGAFKPYVEDLARRA